MLLLLVYDRWAWKWPGLCRMTSRPVLHGTWKAVLRSDWIDPETGEGQPPREAFIVVRQTYSSISVSMLFDISASVSTSAQIVEQDGRQTLWYTYRSEARRLAQEANPPRRGGVALTISRHPRVRLEGDYWTERKTTGEITAESHSKHLCDDYVSAQGETYA